MSNFNSFREQLAVAKKIEFFLLMMSNFEKRVKEIENKYLEDANKKTIKRFYNDLEIIRSFSNEIQDQFFDIITIEGKCECGCNLYLKWVFLGIPRLIEDYSLHNLHIECVQCFHKNKNKTQKCIYRKMGCWKNKPIEDILTTMIENCKTVKYLFENDKEYDPEENLHQFSEEQLSICSDCYKKMRCPECKRMRNEIYDTHAQMIDGRFYHGECISKKYDRLYRKTKELELIPIINKYLIEDISTIIFSYLPFENTLHC